MQIFLKATPVLSGKPLGYTKTVWKFLGSCGFCAVVRLPGSLVIFIHPPE